MEPRGANGQGAISNQQSNRFAELSWAAVVSNAEVGGRELMETLWERRWGFLRFETQGDSR